MAKVRLQGLSKRFGKKVWAVRGFDLEIEDKEFIVMLGPSGCGKTTTLRMVAGLEDPTEGAIYIGDSLVNLLPPRDRDISMVFQSYAVWPHMKVYDNIAFGLRYRRRKGEKLGKNDIDGVVREVAHMVAIEELLDRYPTQLSGGQRQRVALARALAVKPQVFLYDEPLSNLDAKLRTQMRTELKHIHEQAGATSIYVTHDQSEAMGMADRIMVMKQGQGSQLGTPRIPQPGNHPPPERSTGPLDALRESLRARSFFALAPPLPKEVEARSEGRRASFFRLPPAPLP